MVAQANAASLLGQRSAIDHLRASLGERPLVNAWKLTVKFGRQDQLQHGVSEKLQPLIMLDASAVFVRDGRMCDRKAQQIFVLERIPKPGLKSIKVRHGLRSSGRNRFRLSSGSGGPMVRRSIRRGAERARDRLSSI